MIEAGSFHWERLICKALDGTLTLRTGIPFLAPVERCRNSTAIPNVVRPSMGGSRPLDPGSNPGRSTTSFHPIRYRRLMIGIDTIPIDATKAKIIPVIPTPSIDIISFTVISINIDPLVESMKRVASDS
jgi:hypothetical protein